MIEMMNPQRNKFVRFRENDDFPTRSSPVSSVIKAVRRSFERGTEKIRNFKQPVSLHSHKNKKEKNKNKKLHVIMNPNDSYLENWNKAFLLLCVVALAFDPLFFYIPVVRPESFCLTLDKRLEAIACVFRTFIDAFYVIHMVFQFRTGFIPPSSRVFGRGELIEDSKKIAMRYLKSYFIIDVLSILPIPQLVVLAISPNMSRPESLVTKELLKWVIFCQYVPRITRIYPLSKEVTRTSGLVTETAWAGAALNLFLYMLASHVFGSFWYLISIERKDRCWREACEKIEKCVHGLLYCSPTGVDNNRQFLNTTCPLIDPEEIKNSTDTFNFGIFTEALQSGVMESRDFPKKFFFCFWWGLRNLSALGQNLKTSPFEGEIIFAIVICISGLVLFALLIGNMQKYLQSTTVRVEEMRVKRRDAEQWMSHRMLPDELRKRIRRYEQYKWQETRGVEEEALLSSLPKDLRKDIKRHLCLNLLKKVPWFQAMDDRLLDALCARLKTVLYTENSYIVREGEPVEDMLFIMRGNLTSTTTYGGKTGFYNSVPLIAGDFCGDLLTWALDPHSSHLPISSRTVQALTEVEGFVLTADDLKFIATQYRRLHSKQLRDTFRYYSEQWKTWAACFIQAAWKRHCRRKLSKALHEEESKLQNTLQQNDDSSSGLGNKLNLAATIYASRFASNALKNLKANAAVRNSRFPQKLSLLPQKPADPEFPMD